MKKVLSVTNIIIAVLLFTSVFFFGCSDNDADKKEYYSVSWQTGDIRVERYNHAKLYDGVLPEGAITFRSLGIVKITEVAELDKYEFGSERYDDFFFETETLLLIEFTFATGENNITLHDFVTDNEKLYPVFEIDSGQILGADLNCSLFSIEVNNEDMKYDLGEILVINKFNRERGSNHHERFDGVIKERYAYIVGTYNETNISNSYIKINDYNGGDCTGYIYRAPRGINEYYTTPYGKTEIFGLQQNSGNEHMLRFVINGEPQLGYFNSDTKQITLWFGVFKK